MEALRLPEVLFVPPWEERMDCGGPAEELLRCDFLEENLKLLVKQDGIYAITEEGEVREIFTSFTTDYYTVFFLSSYALPKLLPPCNEKDGCFQESEHLPFPKS